MDENSQSKNKDGPLSLAITPKAREYLNEINKTRTFSSESKAIESALKLLREKEQGIMTIRTTLRGEVVRQIEEIQKRRNLQNQAELLRYLVSETYYRTNVEFPPDLVDRVNQLISDWSIKSRYGIISFSDFAIRAISEHLRRLDAERASLEDFEFTRTLSENEQTVAIELLRLQREFPEGIQISQLVQSTAFEEKQVKRILRDFADKNLVEIRDLGGRIYYGVIKR